MMVSYVEYSKKDQKDYDRTEGSRFPWIGIIMVGWWFEWLDIQSQTCHNFMSLLYVNRNEIAI